MKNIIYLAVFFINYTALSQDYKFGKVSKEELQEKFNPQDSSASATYLYKYRRTHFVYTQEEGFELVTNVHERIKIYNQEGFDYATNKINLYKSGNENEKLTNIKAYTYNLIDGEIEKTKLKKDGIFETELHKYSNQKKFTMPNIKEGSVIEYKYKITSPFYQNVDEFEFQHKIPIKKLEAKFETPEYFKFKVNTKGYISVIPKKEIRNDKITFTSKSRSGVYANKTTFNSSDVEFQKNIDKYNLSNIPALKDEPYVNNIDNYKSSVKYELSFTKFPNSAIKHYSTNWDDVVKTIYKSSNFGKELEKLNYFKEDIDAIINGITIPLEKINLIFNYVKQRVKWNKYYGKYTNDGIKKAYKNRTGSVAEINLMLTAMLRYVGLNANPVLVSTRNNGIPLFPTREGYNYVISAIELQDNIILLDATSQYSSLNVLPFRTLNWQGRIIKKNGSSTLVDLYPTTKTRSNTILSVKLNEEGDVDGNVRKALTNHKALSFRESYINKDKEEYLQNLENKHGGIDISDFTVKNELDIVKPIIMSYRFSAEDQYDIIGDKMYINPLFFFTSKENPFKLEVREFPVDFGYPTDTKYNINITLPKNYTVTSLPKSYSIVLPDEMGSFKYNIISNNNNIQIVIKYSINSSIIPSYQYGNLKEFYKQMIKKESEQIVLSKS